MKDKIIIEYIDKNSDNTVYNTLIDWVNLTNNTQKQDPVWSTIPSLPGKRFFNLQLKSNEIGKFENIGEISFTYTYEKIETNEDK